MLTIKSNANNTTGSLNNLDLSFENNGMIFICGKKDSSAKELVKIIGGIVYRPDITITINDFVLTKKEQLDDYRLNYLGFVFGNSQHVNKETVLQNLLNSVVLFTDNISTEYIDSILAQTYLTDKKETLVSELSEFELHCLDIARALLKDPSIIIANNPIARLNDEETTKLWTLLKEISKNYLVVVGNALQEVAKVYADRIIAFDNRVEDYNPVETMIDKVLKVKSGAPTKHDVKKVNQFTFKKIFYIATTLLRNSLFLVLLVLVTIALFLFSNAINANAHEKFARALAERNIDSAVVSRNNVYSTSATEFYIHADVIDAIDEFSDDIDVQWGNNFSDEVAGKYLPHSNQTKYKYPSTMYSIENEDKTNINLICGSWDNSSTGVYLSKSAAEAYQQYFNKYTQNSFKYSILDNSNKTISYTAELFNTVLNVTTGTQTVAYTKIADTINSTYIGRWTGTLNEENITIVIGANGEGLIDDKKFVGVMNGSDFEIAVEGVNYTMSDTDDGMKIASNGSETVLTKSADSVLASYLGNWQNENNEVLTICGDGTVFMSQYSESFADGTYSDNSTSVISELVAAYKANYPDGSFKIENISDMINNPLLFVYSDNFKELNVAGIFEDTDTYNDCIVITDNYIFPETYDKTKFISVGYVSLSKDIKTNAALFEKYATIIRNEQERAYISTELDDEYLQLYQSINKIPGRINIVTAIFLVLTIAGSYLLSYLLLSTYRKELTITRTYGLKKKELYKIVLTRSAIISVVGTVVALILTLIGLTIANAIIKSNYDFIAFSFFTIPASAYLIAFATMFIFTGIFTVLAIRSINKNDYIIY